MKPAPTCGDAALGMEHGTRDLRAPDHEIVRSMTGHCVEAPWSSAAIGCFAAMKSEDLGRCIGLLAPAQRDVVFDELKGTDRASVAIALVKLNALKIDIAACDHFVATVALVLGCEAMPLDTRVQLGIETADFWSLPTNGHLPAAAQQRMATVCQTSLDTLKREASSIGCL